MDLKFADKLSEECLKYYVSLPKKGKPVADHEWTLLSAVVMSLGDKLDVVAMATGTKCLGRNEMSPSGDLINDSHSEVLARRCFLRYIYDQITKFKNTNSSDIIVGCNEKNLFVINPEVKFHFYSSHVPCGDASIIPKFGKCQKRKLGILDDETAKQIKLEEQKSSRLLKNAEDTCKGELLCSISKNTISEENCSEQFSDKSNVEIQNFAEYVISNGFRQSDSKGNLSGFQCWSEDLVGVIGDSDHSPAKSALGENRLNIDSKNRNHTSSDVESVNEDFVGDMVDIHRTGAKCIVGEDRKLPGVLYHTLGVVRTKPGRGDPTLSMSCSDKLARWIACGIQGALLSLLLGKPILLDSVVIGGGGPFCPVALHRALVSRTRTSHEPQLLCSSRVFPHSRYNSSSAVKPCPSAVLWARVSHKPLEVCVEGRRQGATKKSGDKVRLSVSKKELLRSFLSLAGDRYQGLSYREIKSTADQYYSDWAAARRELGSWTVKPSNLENFTL